jgi:diaminopimelate epimerase
MKIHFYKYQANGNDFVVVDNRQTQLSLTKAQIEKICDRRFGVGADGVMLIERHPSLHFGLEYFNSDGSQSLCGNGSRAAMQFASSLGLVHGKATFQAYDGPHDAELLPSGIVRLKMNDVGEVRTLGDDYFINTGSPHYIKFVKDIDAYPVFEEGRRIRYSKAFEPGGTNVNFVELRDHNTIFVRTYERGVENETLACGTGVTAAALAASFKGYNSSVNIKTLGGDLSVEYQKQGEAFSNIHLVGPAQKVFEGEMEV